MPATLSQIQAWSTEHLIDAAAYWTQTADRWEEAFLTMRNQAQSIVWHGAGGDALRQRTGADLSVVSGKADQLRQAAGIARNGASDISAAQRRVLYGVEDAQNAGFTVGEDLSVTDTRSTSPAERAARQAQAEAFAADIRGRAEQLEGADSKVAGQLTASTAGLGDVGFAPANNGVKLVDFDKNNGPSPWDLPDGKQPPAAGDPAKPPPGSPTGLPKPLQDFTQYQLNGQPVPNPPAPNVTADQLRLALMQQQIDYDKFVKWFNTTYGGNVTESELLQRIGAFDAAAMGAAISPAAGPLGMGSAGIGLLITGYQLAVADPGYAEIPVPGM